MSKILSFPRTRQTREMILRGWFKLFSQLSAEDKNISTIKNKPLEKKKDPPYPLPYTGVGELFLPPILAEPPKSHISSPVGNSAQDKLSDWCSNNIKTKKSTSVSFTLDNNRREDQRWYKENYEEDEGMPDKKNRIATQGVNIEPPAIVWTGLPGAGNVKGDQNEM